MTRSRMTGVEQHQTPRATLFLAFELSLNAWKLGFSPGSAQRPRERRVPAREIPAGQQEITKAKQRFGVPADARVVSCYEAGRDGFWLHRC
jgi:transposase